MKGEATPKLERIKATFVGLKMPRALEIVDDIVGRLERGELSALEAIDTLLAEELALRENRRVRMALTMARLTPIKTLAGFDFTFQPSLDRERILALAELGFVSRCEAVHLLGPPGTGKSQVSTATPGSGPRGRVAGDVCLNEVIADRARQSVRRLPGYSFDASLVEQGVKT